MSLNNWLLEIIQAFNLMISFSFFQLLFFYLIDSKKLRTKKNYALLGFLGSIFGFYLSYFLFYSLQSHSEVKASGFILIGALGTISLTCCLVFMFLLVVLESEYSHINITSISVITILIFVGVIATVDYTIKWSEDWFFIHSGFSNVWFILLFFFAIFLTIFVSFGFVSQRGRNIFFPKNNKFLIGHNYQRLFVFGIILGSFSEIINAIGVQSTLLIISSIISSIGLFLAFLTIFQTRKHLKNIAWKIIEFQIEELKEIDLLKDRFIDFTSHELRTPLTIIRGHFELLQKVENDVMFTKEQRQKCFGAINRNYYRIERIINDIYDVSKIKSGIFIYNFSETNLEDLIVTTVADMQKLVEEKGLVISLINEIKKDGSIVKIDPDRISQVLRNLIDNAVKFTNKGEIVLSIGENINEYVISVADSGIGIDPKDSHLVFDQFRLRRKTPMDSKGLGLGLFISKTIVESHDGRIGVNSEGKGKGSTFYFTIPKNN
ncbi:MAG: sensor histidine kinase [Candidatus Hodarchaeales archaeon]